MSDNEKSTQPGFTISEQYGNFKDKLVTPGGSLIGEKVLGVDIWLPIKFYDADTELISLPYSVIRLTPKKHVIKIPMVGTKGQAIEQYSIDDYSIVIKGFVINPNRQFPEAELKQLRDLFEIQNSVTIENAITNIFLTDPSVPKTEQRRVVVLEMDFPEVQGGRIHVRPFSMQLISDTVFTLELK
jgi:hypothetical protein